MSAEIIEIADRLQSRHTCHDDGGDGGPPMDDLSERVTRMETKMDFLATKEDMANIRSELHKEIATSTRWTVGSMFAIATLALAAAKLLGI